MRDCFLFSNVLMSFQIKQNLGKLIAARLLQNGELEALKPHQVESFTVDQSTQPISLCMACIPIRGYTPSFS